MIRYLMLMTLVSGMLTAYYFIALRNRRMHGYNRAFLLAALALSAGLPLLSFQWLSFDFAQRPAINAAWQEIIPVNQTLSNKPDWATISLAVAATISLVLLLITTKRILAIFHLRRQEGAQRKEGYWLIETNDSRAPFSFLDNLFWQRGKDQQQEVHARILQHELAHINGRHSIDGLFAQTLCCIFWMNPFFWIIRRELAVVHEFIADAKAGMEGDAEGLAWMLLQSVNEGRFLQPEQQFFQSPIKRRLVMLNKKRSSRHRALRMGLVAPVLLALMVFISCSKDHGASALEQAKLAKEKQDLAVLKKMPENLVITLKKQAAAAGMSDMDYKKLMERKLLEMQEQKKAATPIPAQ